MVAGLYKVCKYSAVEAEMILITKEEWRKWPFLFLDKKELAGLFKQKHLRRDFMEGEKTYLISDASRKVEVESHVLRYWEDELKLPVKRNELGHRYYTEEDITEFQEIKKLKEQGLQLKAIRMILKNGKLMRLPEVGEVTVQEADEKVRRLEYLMKKLISEAVEESNEKFFEELSETFTKELDYQFRMQEEREEQREERRLMKEEEHYKQLDELLRGKSGRKDKGHGERKKRKLFSRQKKK